MRLNIPAICIFPHSDPDQKTETCERAWDPENIGNRAIRAIKEVAPDLAVMTDIALDPYNANGHDGIVRDGVIVNDETVEALGRMALVQAEAGADILGPSDMMDGRIGALRGLLEANGHKDVAILSYAAKYASGFTGRSAMRWAPRGGWSATRRPIRSTPPTATRRCAALPAIWPRAPIW